MMQLQSLTITILNQHTDRTEMTQGKNFGQVCKVWTTYQEQACGDLTDSPVKISLCEFNEILWCAFLVLCLYLQTHTYVLCRLDYNYQLIHI